MKKCAACGAKIEKPLRYCPYCGAALEADDGSVPRDYWAEQLAAENEQLPPEWEEEDSAEAEGQPEKNTDEEEKPEPSFQKSASGRIRRKLWLPAAAGALTLLLILGGLLFEKQRESRQVLPGAGTYQGVDAVSRGTKVSAREDWLELKNDGSFQLFLMNTTLRGSWKLQDQELALEAGRKGREKLRSPVLLMGTLRNGILRLRYNETEYVFALPGKEYLAERPERRIRETESSSLCTYQSWAGDYYGWIGIREGTGAFAGTDGQCADVCGRISVTPENTGTVALWSPGNRGQERFCMADVMFLPGTTDMGKMRVQWGLFHEMELKEGQWETDPGKSPVSHLPQMLCIRGRFTDPQDPESGFWYDIFLRPWGCSWEDVKSVPPEQNPWDRMLPPQYESWYVPLIRGGVPMPDSF